MTTASFSYDVDIVYATSGLNKAEEMIYKCVVVNNNYSYVIWGYGATRHNEIVEKHTVLYQTKCEIITSKVLNL